MVKEFRVVLAPPLQNGYITNSEVTGHVVLVTDEAKSGYKAIEVTLKGYATVRWTETIGTGENRRTNTYYSHEVYIANTAVPLPPSFSGTVGRIVYEVEAVIIKTAALKFNTRYSVEVPFSPVVDLNFTPAEPKILQDQSQLLALMWVLHWNLCHTF